MPHNKAPNYAPMSKSYSILFLLFGWLCACDTSPRTVKRGEVVNLYSNALTASDQALFTPFEQASGIRVNIINDAGENILARIRQHQGDSLNADVLLLEGINYLQQAKQQALLDTLPNNSFSSAIPANLRDEDGQWLGLGYSAFAIAYRRDSVDTLQIQRYQQLADGQWQNKVRVMGSSRRFYPSLLASMIADEGREETESWFNTMLQHQEGTADSLALIKLVNTATYTPTAENNRKRVNTAAEGLLFPGPETYLHISGAAIQADAPHPERAQALFNYLFSRDFMQQYAEKHRLYPSRPDVRTPTALARSVRFQADTTAQSRIARFAGDALSLLGQKSTFNP